MELSTQKTNLFDNNKTKCLHLGKIVSTNCERPTTVNCVKCTNDYSVLGDDDVDDQSGDRKNENPLMQQRARLTQKTNKYSILILGTIYVSVIFDKMLNIYNKNTNKYFYFVNKTNNNNSGTNAASSGRSTSKFSKKILSEKFVCILIMVIVSLGLIDMANAGTCWVKRTQSGKCKQPMERNVSKEKCCANGDDVGFTEKDMSEFEYFFAMALGDGTTCSSCIDSCSTANCGPHKRCVMRSGQPKCVCAPKCKSADREKKSKNGLKVVRRQHSNTSESQNFHRDGNEARENSRKNQKYPSHQVKSNANTNSQRSNRRRTKSETTTAHNDRSSDVQIFLDTTASDKNGSMAMKSDKIISIVASTSMNNLNSHRFRKNKTNSILTNAQSNVKPSDGKLLVNSNLPIDAQVNVSLQNGEISYKNRHRHRHRYSNHSSVVQKENLRRIDEKIGSWEDRIRSGFYGHDIPYPPIDVPLYANDQYHRAVCGTDGKTYKTECQLRKRACRQESTSLSVAYKGQCQTSCNHVQCPAGQHCLEDQNLMPHCVTCSMTCPPYDPAVKSVISNPARLVCGADGNTYRNLCEIRRAACMLGRSIPVAYRGACTETANCNNIKCKDRQVCLSDLVTHRPRCVSCSFKCPRRKRPQGQQSAHIKLCGMNNKSYHSWCQMMKDSCNTGYFIDVKHNGVCQVQTKSESQ